MILGSRQIHCVAAYINDPLNDMECNVRPVWNGPRCRIVAVRDIDALEEFKMAYGDIFWMRDIFPYELLQQAYNNYATRRTNAAWTAVLRRRIAIEEATSSESSSEPDSDDDQSVWEDETEVVFPVYAIREIIDLTQGEEPVVVRVPVVVLPEAEPVFVPYTLESPELYEDYVVIRNSCA
jgi:hypothetical protein